ncbi:MAG TPA: LCP family protein [Patescibacteria group bacterium]|nr:LCP family protein [Patescibacteria group bacterium]
MKNLDSINQPPKITVSNQAPAATQVDLLRRAAPGRGKRILKRTLLAVVLLIIILGAAVALRAANLSQKIFVGQKTTFIGKLADLFRGSDSQKLVGEDLGQINVLLLGIGGEGHDGPYLSDTMIVAQIRPDLGEVVLISIPRDYLADLPDGWGQQKINAAFSYGYTKNHDWNEGGQAAIQAVEKLTGLQIPYFAVLDFSGFKQAIDEVGGVDVHVDRTFTDYSYPNDATGGYLPPLTFTAGDQHMNGTTSLEFARSRHADGPEGSDFARSQRQEKIIQAFKQKVIQLNLIGNAGTINSLLGTFADHFHTDISPTELFRIYSLIKDKNISSFISLSLDPSTSLICPKIMPDTGAYVLLPCDGKTPADVQNFFKNSFVYGKLLQEKSVIWLSTSTGDRTAYENASNELKQAGLTVWELPYKGQPLTQNIFYQANSKPATAEFLKNTLNATEATLPPPGVNVDKTRVDIIVILGKQSS